MALEQTITAYRFEDLSFPWAHADQADVSNYGLKMEVLSDYASAAVLISLGVGTGITLDGTPNYSAVIAIPAAVLGALAAGEYVFTISRTQPGAARVLSYGRFVLYPPRVAR